MKRNVLVLTAALLMLATTAGAQVRFGVKGGLNISSVSLSSDIISSDNVTGFQIGPMVEVMAPFLGLGFDLGVLYSQKGMDTNEKSISTDYIDVPVNLKWKFGLLVMKGYLAAGPYVNFKVSGDKVVDMPSSVVDQIKAKSFAAGLNLGAGVELIKFLQVGFNYGIGLTDNYSLSKGGNESWSAKDRTWSITAAILF